MIRKRAGRRLAWTGCAAWLLAGGAMAPLWAQAGEGAPPVPVWTRGDPVAPGPDAAQAAWTASQASGPQGRDYAQIAQLPDWSGGWALDDESFARTVRASTTVSDSDPGNAHLQPKWADYQRRNGAANDGHGPAGGVINNARVCEPDGMPGVMTTPLAFEYLFTPGQVTIHSSSGEIRRVYTDGRGHSVDPDLKFPGESIGHWEGDTLVVDTTAILPKSEIYMGLPQAEGTHVFERIRKIAADKLEIRTIVNNPKMFTQPWTYTRTYSRLAHIDFDNCFENLRDKGDSIDLTPPPMDK